MCVTPSAAPRDCRREPRARTTHGPNGSAASSWGVCSRAHARALPPPRRSFDRLFRWVWFGFRFVVTDPQMFVYSKDLRQVMTSQAEKLSDEEADELIRECRPKYDEKDPPGCVWRRRRSRESAAARDGVEGGGECVLWCVCVCVSKAAAPRGEAPLAREARASGVEPSRTRALARRAPPPPSRLCEPAALSQPPPHLLFGARRDEGTSASTLSSSSRCSPTTRSERGPAGTAWPTRKRTQPAAAPTSLVQTRGPRNRC